jgi:DNA-binding protein HU-beta
MSRFLNHLNNIGLNKSKEIYMLNFIKKLFGTSATVEVKGAEAKTTLEFHEEIKQQVEAEKAKEAKPAVKAKPAKAKKPAAKKAPAKATAKKAPAKKSKKQ